MLGIEAAIGIVLDQQHVALCVCRRKLVATEPRNRQRRRIVDRRNQIDPTWARAACTPPPTPPEPCRCSSVDADEAHAGAAAADLSPG